jgi:hypothetical protein
VKRRVEFRLRKREERKKIPTMWGKQLNGCAIFHMGKPEGELVNHCYKICEGRRKISHRTYLIHEFR